MTHKPVALASCLVLAACTEDFVSLERTSKLESADSGSDAPDGGGWQYDFGPRPDAPPVQREPVVYAHTRSDLYKVDPDSLSITLVGPFVWPVGADNMTDIALDQDGNMVGISFTKIYDVDPKTAECVFLAGLPETFNGLSFLPHPEDPEGGERLVGAANNGSLFEIDPMTGSATPLGSYGGGWRSSGDLVFVAGAGAFASAVQTASAPDHLIAVDPLVGTAAAIGSGIGFDDVFGLGFWAGQVYGFTENRFVLIDIETGVGTLVSELPDIEWWGAGVTTRALPGPQ